MSINLNLKKYLILQKYTKKTTNYLYFKIKDFKSQRKKIVKILLHSL